MLLYSFFGSRVPRRVIAQQLRASGWIGKPYSSAPSFEQQLMGSRLSDSSVASVSIFPPAKPECSSPFRLRRMTFLGSSARSW